MNEAKTLEQNRLMMLVTIVNRSKGEFYRDLLQSYEANLQLSFMAEGTAGEELLSRLGLSSTERTVIFSILREDRIGEALLALDDKFESIQSGKGIAFSVPLTGMIGVAAYNFLSNNRKSVKETL